MRFSENNRNIDQKIIWKTTLWILDCGRNKTKDNLDCYGKLGPNFGRRENIRTNMFQTLFSINCVSKQFSFNFWIRLHKIIRYSKNFRNLLDISEPLKKCVHKKFGSWSSIGNFGSSCSDQFPGLYVRNINSHIGNTAINIKVGRFENLRAVQTQSFNFWSYWEPSRNSIK